MMMIEDPVKAEISAEFDTYIHWGYAHGSDKSYYHAKAMFGLAKEIKMLDEFDVKDWQFELERLKDYLEVLNG